MGRVAGPLPARLEIVLGLARFFNVEPFKFAYKAKENKFLPDIE
jgi:hypothetical protein